MTKRILLIKGLSIILGSVLITLLFHITQSWLITFPIGFVILIFLYSWMNCAINKYLTNCNFIYTKKYYDLLVNIHKQKYLSYFKNDKKTYEGYSELFKKNCSEFIAFLEDENKSSVLNYSPQQTQLIKKMLKKAKEMQANAFISDYSI